MSKRLLLPCAIVVLLLLGMPVVTAVPFSSIIITDVSPTVLHPGDTTEVTMTVKNNGGADAKDVKLSFGDSDRVSVVGATVVQLNTLNAWCEREVKVKVHVKDEAPTGTYDIPVKCNWYEPTTKTVVVGSKTITTGIPPNTETITIPQTVTQYNVPEPRSAELGISFNVRGRITINVGDVTTDPADIRPGDENVKLGVSIENSGEAAAKDIEALLICNTTDFKPSWSGTERSYIGRLNSGASKEATFHIDVADGVASGTYKLPLRIRYKDTRGERYETMRTVKILVKPKPDFVVVSYYTEPATMGADTKGVKLHVKVQNVGSEKAESVSVRVTGESEVPFDYDVKSDYIGNLKVGEAGEAILKFDVKKDAMSKEYPQGIEIRCSGDRDLGDDNVYVFDRQIKLRVSSSGPGGLHIPGFGLLFALLAMVVVLVRSRRRKW